MKRKTLDTFGRRGDPDLVRVFREPVDGVSAVRVQWKEGQQRRTRSFDDTRAGIAEAKAYAKGVHTRLGAPVAAVAFQPITVRELYDRYVAAHVVDWRPKTITGKAARWRLFELHVGRSRAASSVTREHLDELKRVLLTTKPARAIDPERKRSANQVKMTIETVTAVYRWGVDNDLIPPSKVLTYRAKFGRDTKRQVAQMAEYSSEDRAKLLAVMSGDDPRGWRPFVVTTVGAYCGARITALLSLEWADVDFDGNRIQWRAATDKMANERWQPMPAPVRAALLVAKEWAHRNGYTGRFVFFRPGAGVRDLANKGYQTARAKDRSERLTDQPYTYAAYIGALRKAEREAGVAPVLYRGAHGFRRGITGDIHEATGSEKMAADWIGDRSIKVVRDSYLLTREEGMRKTAELVANATACNDGESDGNSPSGTE